MSHLHRPKVKRHFAGCVETVPPPPMFTEFIDAHRLWGFPIAHLEEFILEENPEHRGKKTVPPDQITLSYRRAKVVLRGWRLELLVGPLITGHLARIHAEKHLGPLIIEQAWITEIRVAPLEQSFEVPITKN